MWQSQEQAILRSPQNHHKSLGSLLSLSDYIEIPSHLSIKHMTPGLSAMAQAVMGPQVTCSVWGKVIPGSWHKRTKSKGETMGKSQVWWVWAQDQILGQQGYQNHSKPFQWTSERPSRNLQNLSRTSSLAPAIFHPRLRGQIIQNCFCGYDGYEDPSQSLRVYRVFTTKKEPDWSTQRAAFGCVPLLGRQWSVTVST